MNNTSYDEKIIRKYYGENLWHLCRKLFPTLLLEEGKLSEILLRYFAYNHTLCEDIILSGKIYEFKNLIMNHSLKKESPINTNKTAKELLKIAGYSLYICHNEKEIQRFKKYYAKGEELCTFKTERLNDCYVFFAIKNNASSLKRYTFKNPDRQDEYGTSVISIQFTKDGCYTLSIKNRYNDTVKDADATFSNNLDNIIPGLTQAFYKDYGLIQRYENKEFTLPDYVLALDGKYYKYNYKINNIYYCQNNIIIDNYQVKKITNQEYLLVDYFIINLRTKKDSDKNIITLYDPTIEDTFPDTIKNVKKITIDSLPEGKRIIITTSTNRIVLTTDKRSRITSLINNSLTHIEDNFLYRNNVLKNISLQNIKQVGNNFLKFNKDLKEASFPKLENAKDNFIYYNQKMTSIHLPLLKSTGSNFLYCNTELKEIDLSSLENIGLGCLFFNQKLKKINLPNLQEADVTFLARNKLLSRKIKRRIR
mgnify:CR=1 FL=1